MPHGGARPGAGRKKGSTNRRLSEQRIKRYNVDGAPMPLDVMMSEMRAAVEENTKESRARAVAIAEKLAPYMHPRLQAMALITNHVATDMTTEELLLIAAGHHDRLPTGSSNGAASQASDLQ